MSDESERKDNNTNDETKPAVPKSKLLRVKEAAQYLNISPDTLRRLPLPEVRLSSRSVQFNIDDLDRYVAEKTQHPDGSRYPIRLPHPSHKDYTKRRGEMLKKAEQLAKEMYPGKRITGDRLWDAIQKLTGEKRLSLPTWKEIQADVQREQKREAKRLGIPWVPKRRDD
jgi:excisionase family DNA binding protein